MLEAGAVREGFYGRDGGEGEQQPHCSQGPQWSRQCRRRLMRSSRRRCSDMGSLDGVGGLPKAQSHPAFFARVLQAASVQCSPHLDPRALLDSARTFCDRSESCISQRVPLLHRPALRLRVSSRRIGLWRLGANREPNQRAKSEEPNQKIQIK